MFNLKLSLIEIFLIIITHWIADFILQTDKQAEGKSKNWNDLLSHTSIYSLTFWLFILILTKNINTAIYFWIITLITHTVQDYFTSKLNSKLRSEGKTHNFFVSIGFDQVLHYIQLFLTYSLLK